MSIGSLGMLGSLSAAPLAQTKGSEVERASDNTNRAREAESEKLSEVASGIGQTEEEKEASDRDADGRRFWEAPLPGKTPQDQEPTASSDPAPLSKDATGESGKKLDLLG